MNKFKLKSPWPPTGDQPVAIEKLVKGLQEGFKHQVLLGATGTGKTFTMANVVAQINKPTLLIAHNKTLAAQLASEFREFFPENAVEYFVSYYDYYQPEAYVPQIDLYIEKDADINEEIDRLRLAATKALMTRSDVLIVASVSCIYNIGSPEAYKESVLTLFKGQKILVKEILARLVEIQYERNDLDLKRGKFRVKGDTVEIYPAYEEFVVRVSFLGDSIEKIEKLDPTSFDNQEALEEIVVFPARHYVMPRQNLEDPLSQIRNDLDGRLKYLKKENRVVEAKRLEARTKFDLEQLEQLGFVKGIENYSRYFDGREAGEPPYTLIDYFPKDYLLIIDESHMSVPQIKAMWHGERARKNVLIDNGFRLPSAMDNRPLTFEEFSRKVNQVVYTSATPSVYETSLAERVVEQVIRPTGIVDPQIEVRKTKGQIQDLIEEIQKRVKKGQRVLVTTLTKHMAEDLTEFLAEREIKVMYIHYQVDTLQRIDILRDLRKGIYDVLVGINLLREGLDLPEVSLVAILDADKEGFLRSQTSLIQTTGRAARHIEGRVIMYADNITGSMKAAIAETNRRRNVQISYNKKHNITPATIQKAIHDIGERLAELQPEVTTVEELDFTKIPKTEIKRLSKDLESEMKLAAENLEFERAALLRDQFLELKNQNLVIPKTITTKEARKIKM
ncbi:MAG: excinuclease ABC subunit UvrB [Candidatus Woykebacteria bacterium]